MTAICQHCELEVPNRDRLIAHWQRELNNGNGHFHCALCVKLFHTKDALIIHNRQLHATVQDLTCPGCNKNFPRAGALIDHIEKNICTGIRNEQLAQRREQKLAFARELQRRHFGDDPAASDTVSVVSSSLRLGDKGPANFTPFLSGPSTVQCAGGTNISALRPKAEATVRPNPVTFYMKESEFPRISEQKPSTSKHSDDLIDLSDEYDNPPNLGNQWGQKKQLFPDARPPVRPTPEQLEAIREPARTKENAWPDDHPNSPRFKANNYYSSYTKKYKCPRDRCFKSFATPGGLVQHLTSPAHEWVTKVQCPRCLKWFESITALTQHAESQSISCDIRMSDEFRQFLDQLTAGMIDTTDQHRDGTEKYVVPQEAQRVFGQNKGSTALRAQATRAIEGQLAKEVEEKKTYWDTHEPNW